MLTPNKLKESLDAAVTGQEEAKKLACFFGWLHSVKVSKHLLKVKDPILMRPVTFLLLGPTGCGKTYLIQSLARELKLPFLEVNTTNLSTPGWHGANFNDYYETLLVGNKSFSKNNLDHTIVLFDEIDKICVNKSHSGTQAQHHLRLQYSLLKLLEGADSLGDVSESSKKGGNFPVVNTKNFMFVFAGSFENLREDRQKNNNSIGFNRGTVGVTSKDLQTELIDAGIIPELAGRISGCAELNPLTDSDLRNILLHTSGNIVDTYNTFLKESGINVTPEEDSINEIIEACKKKKTGARALRQEYESRLIEPMFEHFSEVKRLSE